MGAVEDALGQLFVSRGWSVPAILPSLLARAEFTFSAENDLAVVVATGTPGSELRAAASHASAAIANLVQAHQGAKAWEVYLLLAAHDLDDVDEDTIVSVQRDLTFCRKIILDANVLADAAQAMSYLVPKLSLLFPLARIDTEAGPSPSELLENSLVEKGHPVTTVRALMNGIDETGFDPMAFLLVELREPE
jgi:hypothetical protein